MNKKQHVANTDSPIIRPTLNKNKNDRRQNDSSLLTHQGDAGLLSEISKSYQLFIQNCTRNQKFLNLWQLQHDNIVEKFYDSVYINIKNITFFKFLQMMLQELLYILTDATFYCKLFLKLWQLQYDKVAKKFHSATYINTINVTLL